MRQDCWKLRELAYKMPTDRSFIDMDRALADKTHKDFIGDVLDRFYRALGIPTEMFTVMFALGRIPGWIAQWLEMRKNMEPIGRPRQIYTGLNKRSIS